MRIMQLTISSFIGKAKVRIGKRVQKYRDILITRIQVISYHYLFVNLKGLIHTQHHILFWEMQIM